MNVLIYQYPALKDIPKRSKVFLSKNKINQRILPTNGLD